MVIRFLPGWVFLVLAGCGSGEYRPEPISLLNAENLVAEGKSGEAACAYARLLPPLREREDFEAHLAQARIYLRLAGLSVRDIEGFRERFPWMGPYLRENSQAVLLSKSAQESVQVVTEVSHQEARNECSSRIAKIFLRKVEDPSIRLRSLGDPVLEEIILLEVAGIYESQHIALVPSADRERLKKILRMLSAAYKKLPRVYGARSFAIERWQDISGRFEQRIQALLELKPVLVPERWEKRLLHLNLKQHLQEGTYWGDLATVERTSKGDRKQCERAYRNALRHLYFVAELLPAGESESENVLNSIPVVLRGWKTVCFREP